MLERIAKILNDYRGKDDIAITESTTFADLELDSLDTVELVMNVEEEFGVTLGMENPVKTVGDLMKLIENAS